MKKKINEVYILEDRGLIYINGEDSKGFLQNIITNDVNKVSENNSCFSALLTPQGKYLYDFIISKHKTGYLLDCEKENIEKSIESLKETLKNDSADAAEIKTKLESLNNAAMKLGEIMYKQNAQGQQTESGQENQPNKDADQKDKKEENVVDADFEEVDEDSEKKSNS